MGGDSGVGEEEGSSPRGRGKPHQSHTTHNLQRLIPARAGKTNTPSKINTQGKAHPRAGGENTGTLVPGVQSFGSSPRGRGKPSRARIWSTAFAAHPRAGGENTVAALALHGNAGSSPRGRGKLGRLNWSESEGRLIPARAGKTRGRRAQAAGSTAHPRAGGENPKTRSTPLLGPGSSPRGRGKPLGGRYLTCLPRLIPARAGKTVTNTERHPHGTAHPRAGGENLP